MTAADDPTADFVRDADRDRWLATLYAPAALRPALFAVWALDLELAKVATGASDAMLAEIKLAWWRERLGDLDKGVVPAQPLLRALAADVLPRGVAGQALASFEDGWLALLADEGGRHFTLRGAAVGRAVGALAGADGAALATAWAAGEAARAGHDVVAPATERAPKPLRWLAGLAALGLRDVARAARGLPPEPRATAGRQWVLLRAAVTGR